MCYYAPHLLYKKQYCLDEEIILYDKKEDYEI